mgnify:CR=1 FL=1
MTDEERKVHLSSAIRIIVTDAERNRHDARAFRAALEEVRSALLADEKREALEVACKALGVEPPAPPANADVPGGVCGECGGELEEDRPGIWICGTVECSDWWGGRAEEDDEEGE